MQKAATATSVADRAGPLDWPRLLPSCMEPMQAVCSGRKVVLCRPLGRPETGPDAAAGKGVSGGAADEALSIKAGLHWANRRPPPQLRQIQMAGPLTCHGIASRAKHARLIHGTGAVQIHATSPGKGWALGRSYKAAKRPAFSRKRTGRRCSSKSLPKALMDARRLCVGKSVCWPSSLDFPSMHCCWSCWASQATGSSLSLNQRSLQHRVNASRTAAQPHHSTPPFVDP